TEGGTVSAQIHSHIKHFALHHSDQFPLGLLYLVMQPAQDMPCATAVIILNKAHLGANGLLKSSMVEAFIKKTAIVTKYPRLDHKHTWQCQLGYFHSLCTLNIFMGGQYIHVEITR